MYILRKTHRKSTFGVGEIKLPQFVVVPLFQIESMTNTLVLFFNSFPLKKSGMWGRGRVGVYIYDAANYFRVHTWAHGNKMAAASAAAAQMTRPVLRCGLNGGRNILMRGHQNMHLHGNQLFVSQVFVSVLDCHENAGACAFYRAHTA